MVTFPWPNRVVQQTKVWKELTILGLEKCILMKLRMIVGLITKLVQNMRGFNVQKNEKIG